MPRATSNETPRHAHVGGAFRGQYVLAISSANTNIAASRPLRSALMAGSRFASSASSSCGSRDKRECVATGES